MTIRQEFIGIYFCILMIAIACGWLCYRDLVQDRAIKESLHRSTMAEFNSASMLQDIKLNREIDKAHRNIERQIQQERNDNGSILLQN